MPSRSDDLQQLHLGAWPADLLWRTKAAEWARSLAFSGGDASACREHNEARLFKALQVSHRSQSDWQMAPSLISQVWVGSTLTTCTPAHSRIGRPFV